MEYRIAILPSDENARYSEMEEFAYRIDKAKRVFNQFIKDAFNGEFVIAYKNESYLNYEDITPQIKVCKKTDWRYGTDENSEPKNRKKFLKFQYLNKLNEKK